MSIRDRCVISGTMALGSNPQKYVYSDIAVQRACELIEADLFVRHAIGDLAGHAGLAEHHFQRRFAAATGETVAGYSKARRMEKAALELLNQTAGILDIALQFGFETHSAFSRAFKSHFGMVPSKFREAGGIAPIKGEHPRPYLIPHPAQTALNRFDLVDMEEVWLCWRKFTGVKDGRFFSDLPELGIALSHLRNEFHELDAKSRPAEGLQTASAFFQGPASFQDQQAVAFTGALTDHQLNLDWPEGWTRITAGRYAIFPHFGPLLTLPLTWNKAARVALKSNDLALNDGVMFETYLTSNPSEPASTLSALIYLPVNKAEQEQRPTVHSA